MKKIVALLLSLLLMLGCAALAESAEKAAAVMSLYNIEVSTGSESQSLGNLAVTLILDATDEPTLVLTAENDTEYLAAGAAKITTDGKLSITLEGVDATYTGDIAELAEQSGTDANTIAQFKEALPELPTAMKQLVPMLDELVLPPFSGVTIPKLDVSALLSGFVTGESDGVTSFTIPYDQFVALMDMVSEYAGMMGSQIPYVDQLTSLIDQLKTNGQGIAVDGAIQDDGTTQTVVFNVLPVDGGTTSETPVFALVVATAENSFTLAAAQDVNSDPMISLAVVSDPSTPRLDVALDAMGSGMTYSMYPNGALQVVELSGNAGSEFAAKFSYGNENNVDVLDFNLGADGNDVQMTFNTAKEDDMRTGSVVFSAGGVTVTADVEMFLDATSPVGITWPETVKDLTELDNSVLQTAIEPLTEYINSLNAAA